MCCRGCEDVLYVSNGERKATCLSKVPVWIYRTNDAHWCMCPCPCAGGSVCGGPLLKDSFLRVHGSLALCGAVDEKRCTVQRNASLKEESLPSVASPAEIQIQKEGTSLGAPGTALSSGQRSVCTSVMKSIRILLTKGKINK